MFYSEYDSPVGLITIVSDDDFIKGVFIDGQKYFMQSITGPLTRDDTCPPIVAARKWFDAYFGGEHPSVEDVPLAPEGTPFRRRIWDILREIPEGETTNYGEIAQRIAREDGKKMSAQAVGGAVGHNPISIIIPCHRVVGADGSMTGYAGGVHIKEWLLSHENNE